jgi:hypothetical protein
MAQQLIVEHIQVHLVLFINTTTGVGTKVYTPPPPGRKLSSNACHTSMVVLTSLKRVFEELSLPSISFAECYRGIVQCKLQRPIEGIIRNKIRVRFNLNDCLQS